MRVLVTGGAGYIGSHTVGRLVEAGSHANLLARGGLYARLYQHSTDQQREALSVAG